MPMPPRLWPAPTQRAEPIERSLSKPTHFSNALQSLISKTGPIARWPFLVRSPSAGCYWTIGHGRRSFARRVTLHHGRPNCLAAELPGGWLTRPPGQNEARCKIITVLEFHSPIVVDSPLAH